jgi:hypothetical protein
MRNLLHGFTPFYDYKTGKPLASPVGPGGAGKVCNVNLDGNDSTISVYGFRVQKILQNVFNFGYGDSLAGQANEKISPEKFGGENHGACVES